MVEDYGQVTGMDPHKPSHVALHNQVTGEQQGRIGEWDMRITVIILNCLDSSEHR